MKKHRTINAAVFAIMGMPMALQLTASCTYDMVTFCFVLLFVSQVFSMITKQGRIHVHDVKLLAFFGMLMAPAKAVYAPLLLLVLLIPGKKLGRTRAAALRRRLLVIAAGILAFAVISFGLSALSSSTVVQKMVSDSARGYTWSWNGEKGYTLGWILGHPVDYILICVRTMTGLGDELFFSMIGGRLARYEAEVPAVFLIGFIILFFAAVFVREEEYEEETVSQKSFPDREGTSAPHGLSRGKKVWCLLLCAACAAGVFTAMLLGWTPLSYNTIAGIQGRYFLPLLPVLIYVLRTEKIRIAGSFRKGIVLLTVLFNIWVLVYTYTQMIYT